MWRTEGQGPTYAYSEFPKKRKRGRKRGREGEKEKEILNTSRGKRLIVEIFGLPYDSDLVSMAQFLWMSEAQYLLGQYT